MLLNQLRFTSPRINLNLIFRKFNFAIEVIKALELTSQDIFAANTPVRNTTVEPYDLGYYKKLKVFAQQADLKKVSSFQNIKSHIQDNQVQDNYSSDELDKSVDLDISIDSQYSCSIATDESSFIATNASINSMPSNLDKIRMLKIKKLIAEAKKRVDEINIEIAEKATTKRMNYLDQILVIKDEKNKLLNRIAQLYEEKSELKIKVKGDASIRFG